MGGDKGGEAGLEVCSEGGVEEYGKVDVGKGVTAGSILGGGVRSDEGGQIFSNLYGEGGSAIIVVVCNNLSNYVDVYVSGDVGSDVGSDIGWDVGGHVKDGIVADVAERRSNISAAMVWRQKLYILLQFTT